MSLLLAATVSLGQLCYNADKDINSSEFMRGAQHFQQALSKAMKAKNSTCWGIESKAQHDEAKRLVLMDSSGETLALK